MRHPDWIEFLHRPDWDLLIFNGEVTKVLQGLKVVSSHVFSPGCLLKRIFTYFIIKILPVDMEPLSFCLIEISFP